MNILITGGTGFIGSELVPALMHKGHRVTVLTRGVHPDSKGLHYLAGLDELPSDSRFDAIVNLAGASLAGKRWNESYKREIIDSRLGTTRDLIGLIQRLEHKPRVLVSASAIGYYGHRGDEPLTEDSDGVPGFSHDLCRQWEQSALEAEASGVRVCLARLGVVLDRNGGAMDQMAASFRLGVANWLGSGNQYISWVHRRDAIRALCVMLEDDSYSGPYNVTAPEPVTSRQFCQAMKHHYRTWITAPVPASVMRLMVGEMADELLLSGQRVMPGRLQEAGFRFQFGDLDSALADIT